jgi:photosystem II stability/assembly factor-like uncharacterized protein
MKTTTKKIIIFIVTMITITTHAQNWVALNTGTTEDLKALQFLDANTGFAAGSNGTLIKTTDGGSNWTIIPTGITQTIRSLFFYDAMNGWLGADNGILLHTADGGNNWVTQSPAVGTNAITSIKFLDANTGFFTANIFVKKTIDGGSNWTNTSSTSWSTGSIQGMSVIDVNNIWISGSSHKINCTHNGATSWVGIYSSFNVPPPTSWGGSSFLDDICFVNQDEGWTVGGTTVSGGAGAIFNITSGSTNNTSWTLQHSGVNELLSIDMLNSTAGWTCGRNGTILFTTDGNTWSADASGVTQHLWQVDFVDASNGFIAGDLGTVLKYSPVVTTNPLTLYLPNGGENFKIGTNETILWGVNGVANVNLEYTVDNGSNWLPIATNISAVPSSYIWNVPNNQTCTSLIRITDASNSTIGDTSDTYFYIQNGQVGKDYAVQLTATPSVFPSQITLNWNADINTQSLVIDRKLKSDVNWTNLAVLSPSDISYIDNSVLQGEAFEYRITRSTCIFDAYGYIYAGIELPETDSRGTILILVDQTFSAGLAAELNQFELDLIGDGYKINKQLIDPTIGVEAIHTFIMQEYTNDPTISTVLTIGHLPAPYSGNFAPDGHAERIGAQPGDGYYGDIDMVWQDVIVSTTNTGAIYTPNVPGDGNYDHDNFPSQIELQVGRIDMNDMDGFPFSELGLLQNYLNKNHDFRLKNFQPLNRAIMNTTMDAQMPTVSSSAWRSYTAMFDDKILDLNTCNTGCFAFRDSISTYSYLWGHMAGGGSDTSMANDVFTSSQCVNYPINSIFMQMYGSYFVEWYKGSTGIPDHLLRAPLASNGTSLATVWSGKAPSWHFHHMALGETIGYSTRLNQNNTSTYEGGMPALMQGIHMSLMGDPTLKMHIVAPVTNITATESVSGMNLSWTASTDNNIVGYNVYRATDIYGDFVKINSSYITSTNFVDPNPVFGNSVYMIRAVKLENEASGSYYNLSTGIFANASSTVQLNEYGLESQITIYPNPTSDNVTIQSSSTTILNIQLYDASGKLIFQTTSQTFSISEFDAGVYTLKIHTPAETLTKKIIKQ